MSLAVGRYGVVLLPLHLLSSASGCEDGIGYLAEVLVVVIGRSEEAALVCLRGRNERIQL